MRRSCWKFIRNELLCCVDVLPPQKGYLGNGLAIFTPRQRRLTLCREMCWIHFVRNHSSSYTNRAIGWDALSRDELSLIKQYHVYFISFTLSCDMAHGAYTSYWATALILYTSFQSVSSDLHRLPGRRRCRYCWLRRCPPMSIFLLLKTFVEFFY